ncbi:hypothetical protein T02_15872 [Trichinella nativa]|uniref:Uncharacterized protein n=1 Tax=Trichinella nativa TaxID=6335 RepID=A0A0V1KK25_9BILA|nr:hypothetical protein T02_15872 [Trichinella nativa]
MSHNLIIEKESQTRKKERKANTKKGNMRTIEKFTVLNSVLNYHFRFLKHFILSIIEDQLGISVVAPIPFVDDDRRKLITHKWFTNADIKECHVHCQ